MYKIDSRTILSLRLRTRILLTLPNLPQPILDSNPSFKFNVDFLSDQCEFDIDTSWSFVVQEVAEGFESIDKATVIEDRIQNLDNLGLEG